MNEIKVNELTDQYRAGRMLMVLDENDIKNTTFKQLINSTQDTEMPVVVAMPEVQYVRGLRGWAKMKILASIISRFEGVMPVTVDQSQSERQNPWGRVYVPEKKRMMVEISETRERGEVALIDKTRELKSASNCWFAPAGSVIVLEGKIVAEAASNSFDSENFNDIPLTEGDLELKVGERMNFGETLHAEQFAVAKAARMGKSLEGATIYVSKFPCLACAMSIIGAGIKKVVFEEESYGLLDAKVLVENGVKLVRVVR